MSKHFKHLWLLGITLGLTLSCTTTPTQKGPAKRAPATIKAYGTLYDEMAYPFTKKNYHIDYEKQTAESNVFQTPFESNYMTVYWPQPEGFKYDNNFLIRYSLDGKKWSQWKDIFIMDEGPDKEDESGFTYSKLVYTKKATHFQFKIVRTDITRYRFDAFVFVFIDSRRPPIRRDLAQQSNEQTPQQVPPESIQLINRRGWGADESIAWSDAQDVIEQNHVHHLVVHHTVGENNQTDEHEANAPDQTVCAEAVRAVEAMHINTNGWQDIGYQYLICQHGYVYQGRRWKVVDKKAKDAKGAHVSMRNSGLLGVVAMGSYHYGPTPANVNVRAEGARDRGGIDEPPENSRPPEAQLTALIDFLEWKAEEYSLDPVGHRNYHYADDPRQKLLYRDAPTIFGHYYMSIKGTLCPGHNLKAYLPFFRFDVNRRLQEFRAAQEAAKEARAAEQQEAQSE
jgi:hypothetical protein